MPMPPPIRNVDPISTRSKPAKPPSATSVRIIRAPVMTSTQFHRFMSGTSSGVRGRKARSRRRLWSEQPGVASGAASRRAGGAPASGIERALPRGDALDDPRRAPALAHADALDPAAARLDELAADDRLERP